MFMNLKIIFNCTKELPTIKQKTADFHINIKNITELK